LNTTKELLNITTRHTSGEEAVGTVIVLGDGKMVTGSSQVAPFNATSKGTKGGNKWQKPPAPRRDTTTTNGNYNDQEVDDFDEGHVATTEHDFKHQTRQLKDHVEKLLEATCLNHMYPIKHKLKGCTMMKNLMTSRVISKGKKPQRDPGGKGTMNFLGEEAVMMINS
jgi:hypothetical protein